MAPTIPAASARARRSISSSSSRANDAAGLFLIVSGALVPIPFGSNRPFFWALWACAAFVALAAYLVLLSRQRGAELRVPLSAFRIQAILFSAVAAFMLVQIAPLGAVLPLDLAAPGGVVLPLRTLSVAPGDTWLAFLRWSTYGIVFFLALQAGVQGRRSKLISRALALIVAALLATQSRMGLFATFAGVTTAAVVQRGIGGVRALALPAAGLLAVAILYGQGVLERAITVEQSADVRGTLYRQVIGMILERPLTGYGAGSFASAYPLFHGSAVDPALTWDYAHSTYLGLWSGLGLAVGTLPILLVASLALAIARKVGGDGASRSATSAALGATVLVAVHSTVDFSLEIEAVAFLYAIVLGLGTSKVLQRRYNG